MIRRIFTLSLLFLFQLAPSVYSHTLTFPNLRLHLECLQSVRSLFNSWPNAYKEIISAADTEILKIILDANDPFYFPVKNSSDEPVSAGLRRLQEALLRSTSLEEVSRIKIELLQIVAQILNERISENKIQTKINRRISSFSLPHIFETDKIVRQWPGPFISRDGEWLVGNHSDKKIMKESRAIFFSPISSGKIIPFQIGNINDLDLLNDGVFMRSDNAFTTIVELSSGHPDRFNFAIRHTYELSGRMGHSEDYQLLAFPFKSRKDEVIKDEPKKGILIFDRMSQSKKFALQIRSSDETVPKYTPVFSKDKTIVASLIHNSDVARTTSLLVIWNLQGEALKTPTEDAVLLSEDSIAIDGAGPIVFSQSPKKIIAVQNKSNRRISCFAISAQNNLSLLSEIPTPGWIKDINFLSKENNKLLILSHEAFDTSSFFQLYQWDPLKQGEPEILIDLKEHLLTNSIPHAAYSRLASGELIVALASEKTAFIAIPSRSKIPLILSESKTITHIDLSDTGRVVISTDAGVKIYDLLELMN